MSPQSHAAPATPDVSTKHAADRALSLSLALLRVEALNSALERETLDLPEVGQSNEEIRAEAAHAIKALETVPLIRAQAYFTLMLGSLHAVVEKWHEWKFSDPAVDGLLSQKAYVAQLAQYRHAVFHAEHYDHRAIHSLFLNDELRAWTAEVAAALKPYFRHWHADPAPHVERYGKGAKRGTQA